MDKFVDVRARGQESQSAIDNLMERFNPFEQQLQQQQDNSSVLNTISTDTTTEPNQTGFHQTTCRTPLSIAYHLNTLDSNAKENVTRNKLRIDVQTADTRLYPIWRSKTVNQLSRFIIDNVPLDFYLLYMMTSSRSKA